MAGGAERGAGAAGRDTEAPSPPASEPRERHWLRLSKFSARERVCREGGAEGEGRAGRGGGGGRRRAAGGGICSWC